MLICEFSFRSSLSAIVLGISVILSKNLSAIILIKLSLSVALAVNGIGALALWMFKKDIFDIPLGIWEISKCKSMLSTSSIIKTDATSMPVQAKPLENTPAGSNIKDKLIEFLKTKSLELDSETMNFTEKHFRENDIEILQEKCKALDSEGSFTEIQILIEAIKLELHLDQVKSKLLESLQSWHSSQVISQGQFDRAKSKLEDLSSLDIQNVLCAFESAIEINTDPYEIWAEISNELFVNL
jgi:hypothetical protein